MKTFFTLTVAAWLLGIAGLSHAGQIASPTIFGAYEQDIAECIVRNVGTSEATVQLDIFDESGNALTPSHQNCNVPIQPGEYCFKRAPISFGVAYACAATSGSAKSLRGTLVLIDEVDVYEFPLRSAELR
jgi:hypothetical protein